MADEDGGIAKRLLIERRKRCVATILGELEKDVLKAGNLPPARQKEIRASVIAAIGSYHDTAIDLMRSVVGEAAINDEALALLGRIDRQTRG